MTEENKSCAWYEKSQQQPFARAERYCACLFRAAITASNVDERSCFTFLLLQYFDWLFRNSEPLPSEFDYERGATGGFIFLHKALKNVACRDLAWDWLRPFLKSARDNHGYQVAFTAGVFSLIAEYPLELNDSTEAELEYRFLKLYEDPDTRWVVHKAYLLWPKKLEGDLFAVAAWCERNGLAAVEFSLWEICKWILENKSDDPEELQGE